MTPYLALVRHILHYGRDRQDRTGTGTRSVFGHQMRFDLAAGFPLVTTKKTYFYGAMVELLWMLRGSTDNAWLNERGVTIWDEWADESGALGPIYGYQWRHWDDQLAQLIDGLRQRPFSRRHLLSAWNVADLPDERLTPQANVRAGRMALAPCHTLFQCFVERDLSDGTLTLSGQLYQRSCDVFLGLPFNLAGYALLIHMLAHHLGYRVGELVWSGGDCHLYSNHLTQVHALLGREPYPLPVLALDYAPERPLWEVEPHEIRIDHYTHHPAIPAPVAV